MKPTCMIDRLHPGAHLRYAARMRKIDMVALALLAASGCSRNSQQPVDAPASAGPAPSSPAASATPSAAADLAKGPDVPEAAPVVTVDPAHPVLVLVDGQPQSGAAADPDSLAGHGFALVNLRDDWTPFIFAEFKDDQGAVMPNRYRPIFIGLANERTDSDGRDLRAGAHNYLELFGIPPSIGLVRKRMLADEESTCQKEVNYDLLGQVDKLPLRKSGEQASFNGSINRLRKQLEDARKVANVADLDALVAVRADLKDELEAVRTAERQAGALPEIVKRLKCEGHLKPGAKFKTDLEDPLFRDAVLSFQMRHMIYEYPALRGNTLKILGQKPSQSNFDDFRRALRERVTDAAGALEDGTSVSEGAPTTFKNAKGETVPIPNLVEDLTQAALVQMGIDTPEKLLAFFKAHPAEDFAWLKVAVRLPPLPEYYSPDMALDLIVDRGDVWYQPMWDDKGVLRYPPRERMPRMYLYLTYLGQRLPIIKWPTTIGGWRAEQASNGYEYYRYKGSDVGHRIIRKIDAGPTWVAPPSTPIRGLVKAADVNGRRERIVNYDEMGPGYLSAYGLVAGYFAIPGVDGRGDGDNGIRAHGSSEYMSITNPAKYSHGCHRLMNHLAVRLYDFLLNHRPHKVLGDQRMNFSREFYKDENLYQIRLNTRGFEFQLTPPLQVNVLEGRIRGNLHEPVQGYFPKPDTVYPPGPPPSPGGGAEP